MMGVAGRCWLQAMSARAVPHWRAVFGCREGIASTVPPLGITLRSIRSAACAMAAGPPTTKLAEHHDLQRIVQRSQVVALLVEAAHRCGPHDCRFAALTGGGMFPAPGMAALTPRRVSCPQYPIAFMPPSPDESGDGPVRRWFANPKLMKRSPPPRCARKGSHRTGRRGCAHATPTQPRGQRDGVDRLCRRDPLQMCISACISRGHSEKFSNQIKDLIL